MKRALVVQLTRFGDLIQTKRLILTLQARGMKVHLCVDHSLEPLAAIIYPQVILHAIIAHGTGIGGRGFSSALPRNYEIFKKLQKVDFDEVYNLNYSPMNYALAKLFLPEIVRGHRVQGRQSAKSRWFDLGFRLAGSRRNNINLVDYWAALSEGMIPADQVNPPAEPKGGGIGVVLAGRESRRSLPYDILLPLILSARSKNKCKKIFLLASHSEQDAGRKLLSKMPPSISGEVKNLAGKTDWKGLTEKVASLDMVVTPDTGTMHLAAHFGVPVLGFFLSSAWCSETGPYGAGHTIIQADTDCSPCVESQQCNNKLKCLEPFKDSDLARFIATRKAQHLPAGLTAFESQYDFLGTTFIAKAGIDSNHEQRNRIRRFIGCHLGLLDLGQEGPFPDLAAMFYKDKDWITA